jgi:hypothetical protein
MKSSARTEIPESMIVYLPPSMYDHAEKAGADMRYYRKMPLIPVYQNLNFVPNLD